MGVRQGKKSHMSAIACLMLLAFAMVAFAPVSFATMPAVTNYAVRAMSSSRVMPAAAGAKSSASEPEAYTASSVPLLLAGIAGVGALLQSRFRSRMTSSPKVCKATSIVRCAVAKADASEATPFVTLKNVAGDTVKVYTYGACVTSYVKGGKELLAIRNDTVLDGKKPIGGGMPICFPQFGPGPQGPAHGFARSMTWSVAELKDGQEPSLVLKLTDSAETRILWDHPFEATYTVTLKASGLEAELGIKNSGTSNFDFTAALHSYWNVSHPSNVKVIGNFEGKAYASEPGSRDLTVNTVGNELGFSEFTYNSYKDISGDVVIQDAGNSSSVTLQSTGWPDVVIWSPWGDEKMGYDKFLGVEPAKFHTPVELAPSEEWVGKLNVLPTTL